MKKILIIRNDCNETKRAFMGDFSTSDMQVIKDKVRQNNLTCIFTDITPTSGVESILEEIKDNEDW